MKRKIHFLLIALMTFSFYTRAAENLWPKPTNDIQLTDFKAPNYQQIKKDISNTGGDCYYPTLLKRFEKCDTTLSLQQLRALFYGSVFQKDYDAYKSIDLRPVYNILNQENPSKQNLEEAENFLNNLIKENPTHFPLYFYQYVTAMGLYGGESPEAAFQMNKFLMLFNAVRSTGDGTSYENAFHIIIVNQSYFIMNVFGFNPTSQALAHNNGQSYDVFNLEDNDEDIEKLYFNVSTCFNSFLKRFPDNDEPKKSQDEIIIPLNSAFTLELEKSKKGGYKIVDVELKEFSDTLCWENDDVPVMNSEKANVIEGVFCTAKYCKRDDSQYKTVLVFKSHAKENLEFDSFVLYAGSADFVSTSNSGAIPNARMTEMWHAEDNIIAIKIGKIRNWTR